MSVRELAFESMVLSKHLEDIRSDSPLAHFHLAAFEELTGGIWPGRYYGLGGKPGVAKSTYTNQLATDAAEDGNLVLFFTAEIPASRLVEKTLVRLSDGALALGDIGKEKNEYALDLALERYEKSARNICYIEGQISLSEMRAIVDRAEQLSGEPPFVFVDYLQLVASGNMADYMGERLAINATVQELREIANDYETPVFAISSINRASYSKSKTDLDAFAGSSAIDYSFDTIFLMTVEGDKPAEVAENMERPIRPIAITTLKNRYGHMGTAHLELDTAHATFRDVV